MSAFTYACCTKIVHFTNCTNYKIKKVADHSRFAKNLLEKHAGAGLTSLNVKGLWVVDSQGPVLSTQLLRLSRGGGEYWGSR